MRHQPNDHPRSYVRNGSGPNLLEYTKNAPVGTAVRRRAVAHRVSRRRLGSWSFSQFLVAWPIAVETSKKRSAHNSNTTRVNKPHRATNDKMLSLVVARCRCVCNDRSTSLHCRCYGTALQSVALCARCSSLLDVSTHTRSVLCNCARRQRREE